MQYCSLQHWTLLVSPVTSTAGYGFCFGSIPSFFLELFLHWSPVAYWAPTDPGSSSFTILSFCLSYCTWDSQGKNTEVVFHSFLQWTTFCQTSPPWPTRLGWPHMTWLSFTELDKAVVHVTRLASFLWLWFQYSALWCSLATPTILLGFLLPWKWGISSRLLQQSAATPPDLEHGVASLGPPVPAQAPLVAQLVKNPPAMWETWVWSCIGKIPWRRERLPAPVFWPGEFRGLYIHGVSKSQTQLSDSHSRFRASLHLQFGQ